MSTTNYRSHVIVVSAIYTILLMSITTPSISYAQQSTGSSATTLSDADKKFLSDAAQGDISEVTLGRLAVSRGGTPSKTFGQHMVTDHSKGTTQVKQLAKQVGASVPQTVEPDAKQLMDRLSTLSGSAFDQVYITSMVEDHKKDIAAYEDEAKNGQNPRVKALATQTLPMLKEHLKMAQGFVQDLSGKTK